MNQSEKDLIKFLISFTGSLMIILSIGLLINGTVGGLIILIGMPIVIYTIGIRALKGKGTTTLSEDCEQK